MKEEEEEEEEEEYRRFWLHPHLGSADMIKHNSLHVCGMRI